MQQDTLSAPTMETSTRSTLPLVSILLLNLNLSKVTLQCLESLRRTSYPAKEIIVVDNGSSDDSAQRIKAAFPEVVVLRCENNLGFTGGNNLAMRVARGDYYLLLNNDTEVDPGFLEPLVEACENQPRAGAASPKILFHASPETIQYAGGEAVSMLTGRGHFRGWGEKDRGQYDTAQPTELAHGAALLVRREVVEQLGALFDDYFIYYEELDWSVRMRRAGFQIWYVPQSVVLHKESLTVGKASPRKLFLQTRNRLIFVRRNSPPPGRMLFELYFLTVALPVCVMRLLATRGVEEAKAFVKGAFSGLFARDIGRQTMLRDIAPQAVSRRL